MALQHTILETDTLESIANQYFGDPSKKSAIITYNKLDYPYIVSSREDAYSYYASGFLKLTRANRNTFEAILRAGSTFCTPVSMIDGISKVFEVPTDTVLSAGVQAPNVFVRCKVAGTFGNVLPGSITEIGQILGSKDLVIKSVVNEAGFTGGREANVRAIGETLFIPVDDTEVDVTAATDINSYLNELGGTDIDLLKGELQFRSGDIQAVTGIDNLVQAIMYRLLAEKGEFPLHPEYGTTHVVGSSQLPYVDKLEEINILESLAQEDRIQDVQVMSLEYDNTALVVELSFRPAGAGDGVDYNVVKLRLNSKGGQ